MNILPLFKNKNVKIINNFDSYTILCLRRELTPGVYSKIEVNEQSWYEIEICCTNIGFVNPGVWIATSDKKTLFYGNYFKKHSRENLKQSFYTGNYNNLLVGILMNNPIYLSGFILKKLTITKVSEESIKILNNFKTIDNMNNSNNKNKKIHKNISLQNQSVQFSNSIINNKFKDYEEYNLYNRDNLDNLYNFDNLYNEDNGDNVDNADNSGNQDNFYNLDNVDNADNSGNQDNFDNLDNIDNLDNVDNVRINCNIEKKLIYTLNSSYDKININIYVYTNIDYGFHIYPVSLGIPKEHILTNFPNKTINFCPYIIETSILKNYENNIDTFYENLVKSRFILISNNDFREDTPIVYEALARGCIPLYLNKINKYTSIFLPKKILNEVKKSNDLNNGCIKENKFKKISKYLIDYTKNNLTTESIAKYVLSISDKEVTKILFLSNSISGSDYLLQQSLLHGFKNILGGSNVIDYPKISTLYKNNNNKNEIKIYLPYGNLLEESDVSRGRISKRIENLEFDIIIIMGIFTENDKKRLNIEKEKYPFFSSISSHYKKNEIFFIDGNSNENKENIKNRLKMYSDHGICFFKDFS